MNMEMKFVLLPVILGACGTILALVSCLPIYLLKNPSNNKALAEQLVKLLEAGNRDRAEKLLSVAGGMAIARVARAMFAQGPQATKKDLQRAYETEAGKWLKNLVPRVQYGCVIGLFLSLAGALYAPLTGQQFNMLPAALGFYPLAAVIAMPLLARRLVDDVAKYAGQIAEAMREGQR